MIDLLLVDDHAMFRQGLHHLLEHLADIGVIDEAGSGADAFKRLDIRSYSLIVLDISMPDRTGWDVLTEIKHRRPEIPVLILSMHPEDQYGISMLKAGASGYVSKECAADDLVVAIRKVAHGGRYISPSLAEKLASTLDPATAGAPHLQLSNREFQVLSMLASGKGLKEIAATLFISEKTVTTYRSRILEKLHLRNNVEITRYAFLHKLLE